MRTHRRGEIKLELDTNTSSAALQKVIAAIKQKLESDTEHVTSYTVHLVAINKNGNIIKAEYFTNPHHHGRFCCDTRRGIISL